jgi:hypothetical protein
MFGIVDHMTIVLFHFLLIVDRSVHHVRESNQYLKSMFMNE